jgi:biopolymer transport protein ExbD
MSWKIRHQGSPQSKSVTQAQIVEGLRDGVWDPTDEVQGPGDAAWASLEDHPQFAELAEELEAPRPPADEEERVDMNALIDVCLVLLIFFMMTTSYAIAVQKTVPLPTLPEQESGKKTRTIHADKVRKQMVRIDAKLDGKGKPVILVENQKVNVLRADDSVDADRLKAEIQKYVAGSPPREEALLDAEGVTWGLVVAVQDAAKDAGIRIVHHRVGKK